MSAPERERILLGQLGALGDCLYATAIARQIKLDRPGCHLTWAVSERCRQVVVGNPNVDEIWVLPGGSHSTMEADWSYFITQLESRRGQERYHQVYLTQLYPSNYKNFDGTVRASIYRAYPNKIDDCTPDIFLDTFEMENVREFAAVRNLGVYKKVILFEYNPGSGQSFITRELAMEVSLELLDRHDDLAVILTSHSPIKCVHDRIFDASELTFREHAELSHYCTLLVGCSSGISWLLTSNWSKRLPTIQLLKKGTSKYASMHHDFEYFGLSTQGVLELTDCPIEHLLECLDTVLVRGFAEAKSVYHEDIPLDFSYYLSIVDYNALQKGDYFSGARSLWNTFRRYRLKPSLPNCSIVQAFKLLISKAYRRLRSGTRRLLLSRR